MSHGINPYIVPLDKLRAFHGSHDIAKLGEVKNKWKREIQENTERYSKQIIGGAPSLELALEQICIGQIDMRKPGFQHAYALELLCATFGVKERNNFVSPIEATWMRTIIDQVMKSIRLHNILSSTKLIYGAWPIQIPLPDEFPYGGTIEADEVAKADATMKTAEMPMFDRDVMQVIGQLRGWIHAAKDRGAGIVCFYY